jgi:hypothetical protein
MRRISIAALFSAVALSVGAQQLDLDRPEADGESFWLAEPRWRLVYVEKEAKERYPTAERWLVRAYAEYLMRCLLKSTGDAGGKTDPVVVTNRKRPLSALEFDCILEFTSQKIKR